MGAKVVELPGCVHRVVLGGCLGSLLGLVLHPDLGGHVLDAEHLGGQVELAVGVWLVGHGGPGEVHHVQGHEAGLQQPRTRQVLLDLR